MSISKPHFVVGSKLHAKVFLFESKNNFFITGSSNLTRGGFENNLEFNYISDSPETTRIYEFFDVCKERSVPISPTMIETYKKIEIEKQKIDKIQSNISDMLSTLLANDAFSETTYSNLDTQYFNFSDYETLFEKNKKRKDIDIARHRQTIENKLLAIDAIVHTAMLKLGLEHHWRKENITSSIIPRDFNQYQIVWCGVRYTRIKTVKYIKELKMSGEGLGFPKYACLQFSLTADGFEVNLYHAVRHDAVDRDYFNKAILDNKFCMEIENAIKSLNGYGFVWYAGESSFVIDNENPRNFISWYKDNDRDGFETYLSLFFRIDDSALENKNIIADTFVEYAKILIPLFEKMSFAW